MNRSLWFAGSNLLWSASKFAHVICLSAAVLLCTHGVYAQSISPNPVSVAGRSLAALTGGQTISDATLTGNATWTAGSDQRTGTVTLKVKGTNASRIDLVLDGLRRTEIRNVRNGVPRGEWIGDDGTVHEMAHHNCLIDAAWFFPALSSSLTSNPKPQANIPDVARLSRTAVSFDQGTLLPASISFDVHADNDANIAIPVEIRFSDYRPVYGAQVPFHIQKFFNRSLLLDISITSVQFNSGVPDTEFQSQ